MVCSGSTCYMNNEERPRSYTRVLCTHLGNVAFEEFQEPFHFFPAGVFRLVGVVVVQQNLQNPVN